MPGNNTVHDASLDISNAMTSEELTKAIHAIPKGVRNLICYIDGFPASVSKEELSILCAKLPQSIQRIYCVVGFFITNLKYSGLTQYRPVNISPIDREYFTKNSNYKYRMSHLSSFNISYDPYNHYYYQEIITSAEKLSDTYYYSHTELYYNASLKQFFKLETLPKVIIEIDKNPIHCITRLGHFLSSISCAGRKLALDLSETFKLFHRDLDFNETPDNYLTYLTKGIVSTFPSGIDYLRIANSKLHLFSYHQLIHLFGPCCDKLGVKTLDLANSHILHLLKSIPDTKGLSIASLFSAEIRDICFTSGETLDLHKICANNKSTKTLERMFQFVTTFYCIGIWSWPNQDYPFYLGPEINFLSDTIGKGHKLLLDGCRQLPTILPTFPTPLISIVLEYIVGELLPFQKFKMMRMKDVNPKRLENRVYECGLSVSAQHLCSMGFFDPESNAKRNSIPVILHNSSNKSMVLSSVPRVTLPK